MRRAVAAALAVVVAASLGGCGGGEGASPPTGFESALASIGGGAEVAGDGYGFVDVAALRNAPEGGAALSWAADALGPGASDLLTEARALHRAGIDVRSANRVVSVAGSYAIGARIDGVDANRFEAVLTDAGGVPSADGNWTKYALGAERQVPLGTALEAIGVLTSRTAISGREIALARSDVGVQDMIGIGSPVTESPAMLAATECLGDVVAARTQLDNFTYLPGMGPDINAVGVRLDVNGPTREILCAIDPNEAEVERTAEALRGNLVGPGAPGVTAATVEVEELHGQPLVRAELELEPGTRPGLLFRAVTTNDLLVLEGLRKLNLDPNAGVSPKPQAVESRTDQPAGTP